ERAEGADHQTVPALPEGHAEVHSSVVWKVKVQKPGTFTVKVSSSTGGSLSETITIKEAKTDRGKLIALAGDGSLALNQPFALKATVKNPLPEQTLTLCLPDGLVRVAGEAHQPVPPFPEGKAEGNSFVTWKVKAQKAGTFTVHVTSSTGGKLSKTV